MLLEIVVKLLEFGTEIGQMGKETWSQSLYVSHGSTNIKCHLEFIIFTNLTGYFLKLVIFPHKLWPKIFNSCF